jgi:hypothetical protein
LNQNAGHAKKHLSEGKLMISQFPDTFPARQYHWVLAKQTKKNGILKVTFETKERYKETLHHPWKLAQSAVDEGCSEVLLYVKGDPRSEVGLNPESVLGLGRRLGLL